MFYTNTLDKEQSNDHYRLSNGYVIKSMCSQLIKVTPDNFNPNQQCLACLCHSLQWLHAYGYYRLNCRQGRAKEIFDVQVRMTQTKEQKYVSYLISPQTSLQLSLDVQPMFEPFSKQGQISEEDEETLLEPPSRYTIVKI